MIVRADDPSDTYSVPRMTVGRRSPNSVAAVAARRDDVCIVDGLLASDGT